MQHPSKIIDTRLAELGELCVTGSLQGANDPGFLDAIADRGLQHQVGDPQPDHGGQEAHQDCEQRGMVYDEHPESVRASEPSLDWDRVLQLRRGMNDILARLDAAIAWRDCSEVARVCGALEYQQGALWSLFEEDAS